MIRNIKNTIKEALHLPRYIHHPYDDFHNIVIDDYKTIYFYIPKVACSTFKTAFANLLALDKHPISVHRTKGFKRLTKSDIEQKYEDYFKFAFVRNPWDRILSVYLNKISAEPINNQFKKNGVAKHFTQFGSAFQAGMTFKEFLMSVAKIPDEKSDDHFRSQYTFLITRKNTLFPDYIGKFEDLVNDFRAICDTTNLPYSILAHENNKKRKLNFRDFYDDETKDTVFKRYQKDILTFNYEF